MTLRAKNIGPGVLHSTHLDATLANGYIPLDIQDARIVSSTGGEAWASSATAGFISSATNPNLNPISTALRIAALTWSSAGAVQVQFPNVILPPDYSSGSSGVLHLIAGRASAASSDTAPTWVANFYGSTGSSAAGTVAITAASSVATEYTIAVPSAARIGYPGVMAIAVNPTSSQDVNRLFGAWLEYTRASTSTT